jgi:mono/diheme cytochrome c family protein
MLLEAFHDKEPAMRTAAIRISETLLAEDDKDLLSQMEYLKQDTSADVRIQLALSLRYSKDARAKSILKELLTKDAGNKLEKTAATKSLEEGNESMKELKASIANLPWADKRLILHGAANFQQLCSTCHGPDGKGLPSLLAPPLAGSPRANGSKDALIRILLNGLKGPVDNKNYPDVMPAQNANNDEYIASVLSYIRNSLGNHADVIEPGDVKKIRKETADRHDSWTLKELGQVKQ